MEMETLLALVAFAFVSSATPGPNNLMLTASGINYGFVRTLPHMLGIPGGFVLLCLMVAFGLGSLFESYPFLQQLLKWLGAAYLLYLAWKIATAVAPATDGYQGMGAGQPFTFWQAAGFQFLNPKAWVMAITAMSSFTLAGEGYTRSACIVALVFMLVNLPSVSLWAAFGSSLRRFMTSPLRLRAVNLMLGLMTAGSIVVILG